MPLVFTTVPGVIQTTSAGVNTDIPQMKLSPVASSPDIGVIAINGGGANVQLTQLHSIRYRLKRWNTAASTGGTALTPTPANPRFPPASAQAQYAVGTLTPGTGGPFLLLTWTSGATGPMAWSAPNPDAVRIVSGGGTTASIDLFSSCALASLNFEASLDHQE